MVGFTKTQWDLINRKLEQNPSRFGMPIRRNNSIVIGSFNALKLGKDTDTAKNWEFLRRFISRFDLIAIQEVMDDLSGIRRLHKLLGPSFKLIVTDTTGAFPGSRGLRERLAFLYRPARVELKELVSDISYDRSEVVNTLQQDFEVWKRFFKDFDDKNDELVNLGKKLKTLTNYAHPAFLTFIRTPQCASFSIRGKNGAKPIDFLGVNAHTLYGKSKEERNREFYALLDWIIQRTKSSKRMYFDNMIVMADLNMQFDEASTKLSDIVFRLHNLESSLLTKQDSARVNFPFLDVHPSQTSLFNTNARKTETFDHISLFINPKETGLPKSNKNLTAGQEGTNGYDYGVFDFVELISQTIHESSFLSLTKSKRTALLKKIKADVSDHMPIWTRISIPGA